MITPRIPSEPISIRSGEGPAPEPGSRLLSQAPRGVIARTDSTRSSMWVSRVAKWPPARVAIQPPRVENSNDCGKWRRVRPCSRSWSSSAGPGRPGLDPRRQRVRVDLEHPVEPAQVEASPRPLAEPRLDPADDAGAAAERDDRRALGLAPARSRPRSRTRRAGEATRSGGFSNSPAERADEVAVGLPERVRGPIVLPIAEEVAETRRGPSAAACALDRLERHRLLDLGRRSRAAP